MQVVVGRVAKSHGLSGEVAVEVRTDSPDERFAVGARLDTDAPDDGQLVVNAGRWHSGRLLVRFDGVTDRDAADALRGRLLVADTDTSPAAPHDEYWDHDLLGCAAQLGDGTPVGEVVDVTHPPGPDLLVVSRGPGDEVLVPFVRDIVTAVDLPGRRVVLDPPDGLLDL